jgi:hypothetical protein
MTWQKIRTKREESMKFIIRTAAIAATSLVFLTTSALAASVTNLSFAGGCPESEDNAECFNAGQATEANVSLLIGEDAFRVYSGFTIDGLVPPATNDINGGTSGTWQVSNDRIDYLAFKADGFFILAEVNGANGLWSTDPADWDLTLVTCPAGICTDADRAYVAEDFLNGGTTIAGLSNVRAFSAVPIPAAVWLFGSGLGLLGWMRRKSIVAK